MNNKPDFSEIFPVGSRVRCESEMWEKRPDEYGTVAEHIQNRYGTPQWIGIRLDDALPGEVDVVYDYRYLDADMRRSMVKLVK